MLRENPEIRPWASGALVVDRRQDHAGQRWRFWGGVLMGLAAVIVIAVPALRRFEDTAGMVMVLAVAALGAGLIMLGGKPQERVVELARLDTDRGVVHILPEAALVYQGQGRQVHFDEVKHIVFGMTRYPLDMERPDIKVEAFTVCLELFDGAVLPVVEASSDKMHSHQIATFLSQALRAPVLPAGLGA